MMATRKLPSDMIERRGRFERVNQHLDGVVLRRMIRHNRETRLAKFHGHRPKVRWIRGRH